jgi:hypothetical protein
MYIMKTATKAIVLTAKGEVNKHFKNALMCARFDEANTKIYPCSWMKSGRNFACRDKSALITSVLKAQGYKFEIGNDAPKGGLEGNYIKVSKTALAFLLQFRKWN